MAWMTVRVETWRGAALALGASLCAQHTPAPNEDPRGVVLDEDAQPIAGAAVSLQWEQHAGVPFGRAIATRLQRSPLPATRSGRDGSYVLPLTNEQRQIGAPGHGFRDSGCWLVVEKDGYVPWREPIPAGLPSYLGSRVLLRRVRADDEFADLPWPPAIVAMKTERTGLPWLAPGEWNVATSRRGGRAGNEGIAVVDGASRGEVEVTVTAGGVPVPGAQLWFDDGAFALPAGESALPAETDRNGRATARVPAGKRALRVTAPGLMPADVAIDVERGGRVRSAIVMVEAFAVDLLAVAVGGVAVPFRKLDVVPHRGPDNGRRPFVQFSDAQGRARVFVDDPAAWFAYGDVVAGRATPVAIDRAAQDAGRGVVPVVKHRAVTVRLRGDEWPTRGTLRWGDGGAPAIERAFDYGGKRTGTEWVVFRLCFRESAAVTLDGGHGVPFRIRREDLPPMPKEPLLDLVQLDRRMRKRAELVLPAELAPLRGFRVQASAALDAEGEDVYSRERDGRWWLMARDDAPFDAVATAVRMRPYPFTAPAAVPGEPPRMKLPMVRR